MRCGDVDLLHRSVKSPKMLRVYPKTFRTVALEAEDAKDEDSGITSRNGEGEQ